MANPNEPVDIFAEAEAMARADADRYDAHIAKPEVAAKIAARRQEEFERGVRLGWWDAEGNPIPQAEEPDEDGEDED